MLTVEFYMCYKIYSMQIECDKIQIAHKQKKSCYIPNLNQLVFNIRQFSESKHFPWEKIAPILIYRIRANPPVKISLLPFSESNYSFRKRFILFQATLHTRKCKVLPPAHSFFKMISTVSWHFMQHIGIMFGSTG